MKSADILVVDDVPQIFKLISHILKNFDYRLAYAENGLEALDLISETTFKVIIADIKMTNMDGIELLDKVHEYNRDVTRIVLSGHTDVELILKLVNQRGIDRYLTKPCDNADLILSINKCIELYDLRYQAKKQSLCS